MAKSVVLTVIVGLLFISGTVVLIIDNYADQCPMAEISTLVKIPVCGKGAFLIIAGIIVLFILSKWNVKTGGGGGGGNALYFRER